MSTGAVRPVSESLSGLTMIIQKIPDDERRALLYFFKNLAQILGDYAEAEQLDCAQEQDRDQNCHESTGRMRHEKIREDIAEYGNTGEKCD